MRVGPRGGAHRDFQPTSFSVERRAAEVELRRKTPPGKFAEAQLDGRTNLCTAGLGVEQTEAHIRRLERFSLLSQLPLICERRIHGFGGSRRHCDQQRYTNRRETGREGPWMKRWH